MLQVAYLGSSNLFGRVVTTFLKQFPSIKRLNIYGCTDTADLSEEFQQSCKVHQYAGKEQLPAALENVDIVVIGDEIDTVEPSRECILNISSKIFDYAFVTASVAPKAMVVVSAKPLNLMVPLLGHVLQELGCFDGRKLVGVTSEETLRSNPLFAELAGLEEAVLPVVGGASPQTRVPLFSQAKPCLDLKEEDKHKLINEIKSFDLIFPKEEIAAERAYATIKLLRSLIRGLEEEAVTEMALTKTSLVADTSYFSLPVKLGRGGVERAFGLPALQGLEEELLDYAVVNLNHDLTRAYDIFRGLRTGLEGTRHQDHKGSLLGENLRKEVEKGCGLSTFPAGGAGEDRSERLSNPDQEGSNEVSKLNCGIKSPQNNFPNTENKTKIGSNITDMQSSTDPRLIETNQATMEDQICCPLDEIKHTSHHCVEADNEPAKQVADVSSTIESEDNIGTKVQSENLSEEQLSIKSKSHGLLQSEKNETSDPGSLQNSKQFDLLSKQFEEEHCNILEVNNEKPINNNRYNNIFKNEHKIQESLRRPIAHGPISYIDESKIQWRKEGTGEDTVQDSSRKEKEIQLPSKSLEVPSNRHISANSTIVCNSQQSNYTPESKEPSTEPYFHDSKENLINESESIEKNVLCDDEETYDNELGDQEKLENKTEAELLCKTKLSVPCPIDHQLEWENKSNNHLTFTEYSILADQGFTSQVLRKNSGFNSPKKQHQMKNISNDQKSEMSVNTESDQKSKGEIKMENYRGVKEVLKDNKAYFKEDNIYKTIRNKNSKENYVGNKQANKLYQSPTDVVYRGSIKKNNVQKQPQFKMANKYVDTPIKKTQQYKLQKSPKIKPFKRNEIIEKHVAIRYGKDLSNDKGKKSSLNYFGNFKSGNKKMYSKTEENGQHYYKGCTQKFEKEHSNPKDGQDNKSIEGKNKRIVAEKNRKHVNVFSGHYNYKSNDDVPKDNKILKSNAKKNEKAENISHDDKNVKIIAMPIITKSENKITKVSNENHKNELMKIPQNEDKSIKTTAISFVNSSITESLNAENQQGDSHREGKLKLENNIAPFQNLKVLKDKPPENVREFVKGGAQEQGGGTEKYSNFSHPLELENKSNTNKSEEILNSNFKLSTIIKEKSNHEVSLQRKSIDILEKCDTQKLQNFGKPFKKPKEQNKAGNLNIRKKQCKISMHSLKRSLLNNTQKNKIIKTTRIKGFPNINPSASSTNKLNSVDSAKSIEPNISKSKLNIKNNELSIKNDQSILGRELALNLGIKQSFIKNKLLRKENSMSKKRKGISNVRQNATMLIVRDSKGKRTAKKEKKIGDSRKANPRRILSSTISNDCISKNKTQVEINKRGIITSSVQMKHVSAKTNPENLNKEKSISNESPKAELKIINRNKVKIEDKINHGPDYNKTSNIKMEEIKDTNRMSQNKPKPPLEQKIDNGIQSLNKNTNKPSTFTTEPLKTNGQPSPKKETQEKVNAKEVLMEKSISVSSNNIENSFTTQNIPTTQTNNSSDNSTKLLSFVIHTKTKTTKPLKRYTMLKKGEVIPMIKQDFNVEGCKAKIYEQSCKLKANNVPKIVKNGKLIKEKEYPYAIDSSEPVIQVTKSALSLERSGPMMTLDRIRPKSGVQKADKIPPSRSAHNLSLNSFDINSNKTVKEVNKLNIYKINQHKNTFEYNEENVEDDELKKKDKNDTKENNSKSETNNNPKIKLLDNIASNKRTSLKGNTSVVNNRIMTNCVNENKSSMKSEKSQKIHSITSNLTFGPSGKPVKNEIHQSTVKSIKREIPGNITVSHSEDKLRNLVTKSSYINNSNCKKTNSPHTIHNAPKKKTYPDSLNRPIESPRKIKSEIIYKIEQPEVSKKGKRLNTNNHKSGSNQANMKLTETNKLISKGQLILETEKNTNSKKKHELNSNATKTHFFKPATALPTTNINNLFNKFLTKSLKKRANDSILALHPWSNIKNHVSDNKQFSSRKEQSTSLNANIKLNIKDFVVMDKNLVVKKDIPQPQAVLQQNKLQSNYLRWSTKALKASHGIKETNSTENKQNKSVNAFVVPLRNPFSVGQIKMTSGLFKEYMNKNRNFNLDNSKASHKRNFISPGLIEETPKNKTKKQDILKYDRNLISPLNKEKNRPLTKEKKENVKVLDKSKSQNEKVFVSNINQLHKVKSVKEKSNEVRSKSVLLGNMNSKSENSFIGSKIKKGVENPTPEVSHTSFRSARVDKTMKPAYTPSARNFLDLTPTKIFKPYSQKKEPMKKIHTLKAYKSEDKTKKVQLSQDSSTNKNAPHNKKDTENYNNTSYRQKNYSLKAELSEAPQSPDRERPMFHPSQAVRKLKEEKSGILKTEPLGHFRNHLQRLFNMFQSVISNETK